METVTHDGRTTAYRVSDRDGDAAPMLCIHGSGGSSDVWKAQLSRLSGDRPVAALDLSGHGNSDDVDTEPGPATLDAYADDVTAVVEATDARILLGNSLGGAVAMHVVLERDLALNALVLAGTGAKLAVNDDLLDWLENDFDRAVDVLHSDDFLFHDADDRYVNASKDGIYATGSAITSRDFRTCDVFDVRDRLDEIDTRTLALGGEHDQLTPPFYHEYVAENVQNGTCTILSDTAHLAMIETPDAFNDAVATFLD